MDLFWFRKAKYDTKLRDLTPDELWKRECLKIRKQAGATTAATLGFVLLLPTFGLAAPGVVLSVRKAHLARVKRRMVKAEIKRRNLPRYKKQMRDFLIPIGIATTVFSTIGIIDIVCFTGTSSAVAFDAGNGLAGAVHGATNHPGEFFTGAGQGFLLQAEQFFNVPGAGENLNINGHTVPTGTESPVGMAQTSSPEEATSDVQTGYAPTGNGRGAFMARSSYAIREFVDGLVPGGAAQSNMAVDQAFAEAGASGDEKTQSQISGIAVAMMGFTTIMKQAAAAVIQDTHLGKMAQNINPDTEELPPPLQSPGTTAEVEGTNDGHSHSGQTRTQIIGISAEIMTAAVAEEAAAQTDGCGKRKSSWAWPSWLTEKSTTKDASTGKEMLAKVRQVLKGEVDVPFMFLSLRGAPISQQIEVRKCHRINLEPASVYTCRFCIKDIDASSCAYYHCCECSGCRASQGSDTPKRMDICELCVASRGCSCTAKREHVLFRQGCLSEEVDCAVVEALQESSIEELVEEMTNEDDSGKTSLKEKVVDLTQGAGDKVEKRSRRSVRGSLLGKKGGSYGF